MSIKRKSVFFIRRSDCYLFPRFTARNEMRWASQMRLVAPAHCVVVYKGSNTCLNATSCSRLAVPGRSAGSLSITRTATQRRGYSRSQRDGATTIEDPKMVKAFAPRGERLSNFDTVAGGSFTVCSRLLAAQVYSFQPGRSLSGFARPALSTAQPWSAFPFLVG